jgi:hypothetical protein
MSNRESVIAALLLVVIIGIPQASQTLTNTMDLPGTNKSLEDPGEKPIEITSSRDADSFNQTVSSSHERTVKRVMTNRSVKIQETPEFRIKVEKRPGKEKKVVKSSEGKLTVVNSSEMDMVKVEGPEGVLTRKTVDGDIDTNFKGVDIEDLRDRRERLLETMEENLDSVETSSSQENRFDIYVQPDTSLEKGEYVMIENTGNSKVDLEGWHIEDKAGSAYTFTGNSTLGVNETIRVYSGYEEAEYYWGDGAIWNEGGDTVKIFNREDELVAEHSYS